MATRRNVILTNNEVYHIFNRGINRMPIFIESRDYQRMVETFTYYQHKDLPMRFSYLIQLPFPEKERIIRELEQQSEKIIEIYSWCLMPNHFHFLLRQLTEDGIKQFTANITNSFAKYFNVKNKRNGHLFEGLFKSVHMETSEQLIHVSRYIHLNPVTSFVIRENEMWKYPWSSLFEYVDKRNDQAVCNTQPILDLFPTVNQYKKFISDHVDYARRLDEIKHLCLE